MRRENCSERKNCYVGVGPSSLSRKGLFFEKKVGSEGDSPVFPGVAVSVAGTPKD